jgi:hypothetical protein
MGQGDTSSWGLTPCIRSQCTSLQGQGAAARRHGQRRRTPSCRRHLQRTGATSLSMQGFLASRDRGRTRDTRAWATSSVTDVWCRTEGQPTSTLVSCRMARCLLGASRTKDKHKACARCPRTHAHTHAHAHTHTHARARARTHTHTRARARARTHAQTTPLTHHHSHTPPQPPPPPPTGT